MAAGTSARVSTKATVLVHELLRTSDIPLLLVSLIKFKVLKKKIQLIKTGTPTHLGFSGDGERQYVTLDSHRGEVAEEIGLRFCQELWQITQVHLESTHIRDGHSMKQE